MSNSGGMLLLLVSVSVLLVCGLSAINEFHGAVNQSDADAVAKSDAAVHVINPIWMLLGGIAVAVGAFTLIKAYGDM